MFISPTSMCGIADSHHPRRIIIIDVTSLIVWTPLVRDDRVTSAQRPCVGGGGDQGGGLVHNTIWDCGEHYNTIIESDQCGYGAEGWRTARVVLLRGWGVNAHAYAVITFPAPRRCESRFLFTDSKQKDVSTEQTNGTHSLLFRILYN